jgi:hypothetical protein
VQLKLTGGGVIYREDLNDKQIIWIDILTNKRIFLRPTKFCEGLKICKLFGYSFAAAQCENEISRRWMRRGDINFSDLGNNLFSTKLC